MSDPNREGEAAQKARRGRNLAIAIGLVVFVILVYVVTLANMGGYVATIGAIIPAAVGVPLKICAFT